MTDEDRLRRLLSDPGWSLPAWPDAQARIRRAARRQRRRAAAASAVLSAVVIAAAAIPAVLLGQASPPVAAGHQNKHPSASASPRPRLPAVPAVGAAGFPARIYPAATRPHAAASELVLCPDPAGLEAPGPATPAAARTVLARLGQGFASDLHASDRAAWPLLASSWSSHRIRRLATAARNSVRYSGPLQAGRGRPADLYRTVVAACGTRVARATWAIIYGPARTLALDSDMLFLTRRGHMLFYSTA